MNADPGATSPPRWSTALRGLLLLAVAALYVSAILDPQFNYRAWGDRDLLRGATAWTALESSGAELSSGPGARIPGPATSLVMGVLLSWDGDPETVFRAILLLAGIATFWVHRIVSRRVDPWSATLGTVLWGTSATWWASFEEIWNPGLLPIFFAAMLYAMDRLVGDRRPDAWVLLLVAAALGSQLHLSLLLFLVMALVPLLLLQPAGAWRHMLAGLAAAAATFTPYVVEEWRNGGHNNWMLTRQDIIDIAAQPQVQDPSLTSYLALLAGNVPTLGTAPGSAAWTILAELHYLPFVLALGAAVWCILGAVRATHGQDAARDRVLTVWTTGMVGSLIWYGLDPTLHVSERYLLLLVPIASVLAGMGMVHTLRLASRQAPWMGLVGASVTAAVALTHLAERHRVPRMSYGAGTYQGLTAVIDEALAKTGWDLTELAGRTIVLRAADTPLGVDWVFHPSIDYLLHAAGTAFPGSLPGPCAVLVSALDSPDGLVYDVDWLDRLLAQKPSASRVLAVHELPYQTRLVIYERQGGRCPASMTTRYSFTPAERQIGRLLRTMRCGDPATEVPDARDGVRRLAASIAPRIDTTFCNTFGLAVDLTLVDGRTAVTLHSNQLRGDSSNSGPMEAQMIRTPRIRWTEAITSEVLEQTLDEGWVGYKGALTPLVVEPFDLPPGTWSAHLVSELVVLSSEAWPIPDPQRVPIDLLLTSDWRVP